MTDNNKNGNSGGHQFDDTMSERYLFGELSDAEQEQFENAYFSDDAFFERFLSVKNDLLDLYARGELDEETHARMEQNFFRTEPRRKRIGESRDFIRAVSTISARQGNEDRTVVAVKATDWSESVARLFTPLRFAGAAVLLLAAIGGAWLLSRSTQNSDWAVQPPLDSGEINTNQEFVLTPDNSDANSSLKNNVNRPVSDTLPEPDLAVNAVPERSPIPGPGPEYQRSTPEPPRVAQNDPPNAKPPIVDPQPSPKPDIVAGNRTESITLSGASRSATKHNTAEIGSETQSVSVRLLFGGQPYPSYSVKVATIGGSTVFQLRNLKAAMSEGAKSLTVNIPASSLSRKDYIVTLDGRTADGQTETIREYYFHVERFGSN